MTDWATIIEQQIKEAMEQGRMSNLPGEGKPLNLDDDPYTPAELRLAHKILRDNDLAPEWIMLGRELDEKRVQLLVNVLRGWEAYRGALHDARRLADPQRAFEREERAHTTWELAQKTFHEAANQFNRDVTGFNLKAPRGIPHKRYLDLDREMRRLLG